MKNRVIIEQQLKEYPDVVSIAQCQKLLGGIGQATVMKLIKAKRLPSVFVKNQYLRWNLSRGFSAKHNVSENSVQNICRAVSPQRMRIIGSMVFFYL